LVTTIAYFLRWPTRSLFWETHRSPWPRQRGSRTCWTVLHTGSWRQQMFRLILLTRAADYARQILFQGLRIKCLTLQSNPLPSSIEVLMFPRSLLGFMACLPTLSLAHRILSLPTSMAFRQMLLPGHRMHSLPGGMFLQMPLPDPRICQ
jgi:hypothetical protein